MSVQISTHDKPQLINQTNQSQQPRLNSSIFDSVQSRRAYQPQSHILNALEQTRHDLVFLKTFFSDERSINERLIEETMAKCGNDREQAFDLLMRQSSCGVLKQSQKPVNSQPSKRKRQDFENEHMSSSSSPSISKSVVQMPSQQEVSSCPKSKEELADSFV